MDKTSSLAYNKTDIVSTRRNVKATFTDIRREDRGSIIGLSRVCEQYIILSEKPEDLKRAAD